MKYDQNILLFGKTKESIHPSNFWVTLSEYLQEQSNLYNCYDVSLGLNARSNSDLGETKKYQVDCIAKALRNDAGDPVMSITRRSSKSLSTDQYLLYFSPQKFISLSGKIETFPRIWDPFFKNLDENQQIINAFIHTRSLIRESRPHKDPPNNNLFLGPGLSNDRGDYLQGVSAEMWLGESFWQYAACTKEHFLAQDWLKCDIREHHIHVEAYHEPFTTTEGEQGEIQRRLLKLLFDIDENNPCGNKGIPPQDTKEFRLEVGVDKQGNVTETKPIQETKKRWWKK